MPNISCIIVSYNNEILLKDAITSVIDQTLPIAEIIIADDCSTDNSRALIASFAHKYPQICPIYREKNIGVAANRDLAIRAAKSELITTLDGDDWYSSQKIEREFLAMKNNSKIVAFSDVYLAHQDIIYSRVLDLSELASLQRRERLRWMVNNVVKIPRDMLLPKKLYLDVGGIRDSFATYEDWDFKIRLAASSNQWVHSGIVGSNYRQTEFGLSKMGLLKHFQDQCKVLIANHELLKEHLSEHEFLLAVSEVLMRAGRSFFGIRSKLRKLRNLKL
ncbi:MAG: glycosyltransferase family 2 protein [Coleofasciculus sp. B1-GNL1-01]|uniref:glycosyltransferase family 2 protein n=1 Tax=Coleofasciculus sp. B1-GNL1-01 TaxID=3068484 RepID=UPI00330187AB